MNFTTIDLDYNYRYLRSEIAKEIMKCPSIQSLTIERSPSRRGFHYTIFCTRSAGGIMMIL